MDSLKSYIHRIKQSIFHRDEMLALEVGIPFGPMRDPKGTFNNARMVVRWQQPTTVAALEDSGGDGGRLSSWLGRLGGLRRTA